MPFSLPTANTGGDAPQVEDGLAILRFNDLVLKEHPDWAGTDKFGKADDGQRYHFQFTLMTEDREVAYDEGDPVELEALTRTATGPKSNFAAYLKGILTPMEFMAWEANEPFDGSKVQGRLINAQIAHNAKNWPLVEATLGPVKPKAVKKTKAELQAEAAAMLAAAEEAE